MKQNTEKLSAESKAMVVPSKESGFDVQYETIYKIKKGGVL